MPAFSAHLGWLFTELPFPDRFVAAADAGFRACELRFPFGCSAPEIGELLDRSGLRNVLFNMPAGDWEAGERGIAAIPGRESEFREGVHRSIEYARALKTPMLHAMSGKPLPGVTPRRCHETLVENLRYAAREASREGLVVTIEPINQRDAPGYFLATQRQANEIREEVGETNVRMQVDLYHLQIAEGDIASKLREYLPHIAHIQVASVPARHEPDDGEVNYPYLFTLLDQLGYAGWVGCEYRPRGRTEEGLAWAQNWVRVSTPSGS